MVVRPVCAHPGGMHIVGGKQEPVGGKAEAKLKYSSLSHWEQAMLQLVSKAVELCHGSAPLPADKPAATPGNRSLITTCETIQQSTPLLQPVQRAMPAAPPLWVCAEHAAHHEYHADTLV